MTLNDNQKYLIMLHTNRLCLKLIDSIFKDQQEEFDADQTFEADFLIIASNYIELTSGVALCNDVKYRKYLEKNINSLGYSQVMKTSIFKYALELRGVFKGDEQILKDELGLSRFGELPNSIEIRGFMGTKFRDLATTFRDVYKDKTVTNNVQNFIKERINNVLDPDEYLLG